MSLESNIAALVAASTKLTQAVNITKATVEATRDSAIAKEAPVTVAKDAVLASTTAASTGAATTAAKLTAVAADYATQKTTKGLAAVQTSADSELKDRLHRRDPARHPFRGARPSLVMDFVRRECHRNNAAGNLEPVDLSTFMTFTRGSTATYVGPDGLIKTAGVNEARYGYDPVTGEALGLLVEEQRTNFLSASDTSWWAYNGSGYIIPRAGVAPDGTLSAARVIGTSLAFGNGVFRSCTISTTGTVTISVYIKAVATGGIRLSAEGASINNGSCCEAYFAPLSGYSASGVTAGSTASSVNVGGGWYRLWLTAPATSTTDVRLVVYGWDNTMFTDFYIWGAQVEAGSFPTSYIPTPATFTGRASTKTYFDSNGVLQTAASGVAVTDYGFVDGRWVSKGLSLEGQATNLLKASVPGGVPPYGELTTVNYITASEVLGFNALSVTGDSWVEVGSVVGGNVALTPTTYCFSVFSNTADIIYMYINSEVEYKQSSMRQVSANVYRHWVVGTVSTNLFSGLHVSHAGGTVLTGFQLEVGSYPTSYIPTTTAQVTRAADTSTSAQVTRAQDNASSGSTLYNMDAGTTLVSGRMSANGAYPGMYNWVGDYFVFRNAANGQLALNGRGSGGLIGVNATDAGNPIRHATARGRGYIKSSANNGAVVGAAQPLVNPAAVSALLIGEGSSKWNGYIKQLTYFPRQLSDADLQALTILED